MTDIGPQATPAWRQNVPSRLVIVPDVNVFVEDGHWSERVVHDMLKWTDISAATDNWQGIAIATPYLHRGNLFRPSFLEAWQKWALNTKIRIVLEPTATDDFYVFGPPGTPATVNFFCREFFADRSPMAAWADLFGQMIPGCELDLDGRLQLEGWLNRGQVVLESGTSPQEIVVLRKQTQSIYKVPTRETLRAAS